jgi:L-rhamnose mutarotase
MQQYFFALDLQEDPALIAAYEAHHRAVWPEILQSIRSAGIEKLDIYRVSNRLFMVMETNEQFSFEEKAASDAANPIVQQWETLMWQYQQALPGAAPGEKWQRLHQIFSLP